MNAFFQKIFSENVLFKLDPTLRRNLLIFFGAALCFWSGLAGMLPNLSLYIKSFGASNQEVGWVMASFAIGLLGFRPRMAHFSDTKGRKPALFIGVSVIAIAPLLYLTVQFLPQVTIPLSLFGWQTNLKSAVLFLALFRAFHGLSIAAFSTAYTAAVADMAPPQHRGELIGYASLASPTGLALGPALGGFLQGDFVAAFLTMTALGLVGVLCVFASREPVRSPMPADMPLTQPKNNFDFWKLLLQPSVRIPALILFMVGIAFGSMVAFVPLKVDDLGLAVNIGLIYTMSAIASFSIRMLAGKASDQLGRGRFISSGLIFYSLSMFVLWQSDTPEMFLLGGALQGCGSGTLIPIIAALMADRSRPGERGLTFGLCLTGFDLGIALAGPVMGRIADVTSYDSIFVLAGTMTLLGLLIFITTSSKDLAHSIRFALRGGRDVYAIK